MAKIKMNLEKALKAFEHRDEYRYLLWMVEMDREAAIRAMDRATNEFEAGKLAGHVAALDTVLANLTPNSWLDSPYDEE